MPKQGKRYAETSGGFDKAKLYPIEEAIDIMAQFKKPKFDETVDVSVGLGVDPKHADQMVRGTVNFPHGTGKTVRVLVITKGEKEAEAKDAGADHVGGDDYIEKIQGGWLEFDKLIATPDMMAKVGKLGTILGPRGLMPNPKAGTVTAEVGKAVKEVKAGRVEYRVDKNGIIHSIAGKASFQSAALKENLQALMSSLLRAKPATAKGAYVKNVTVSTTMGPGIKVDPSSLGA